MASKHFNKNLVARRYAHALFDLASDGKSVAAVAKDLHDINEIIASSQDFADVIASPIIPRNQITNASLEIFAKLKINDLTTQFCRVAGHHGRLGLLCEISSAFDSLIAENKGEVTALVTSAAALNKTAVKDITAYLAKATGKKVKLEENIDKSIISGLTVTIGSKMLDSSLSGKLERIELYLKNAS